jgi:hypothetical protein
MQYIDFDRLENIDERAYQAQKPFPWISPEELLTGDGYSALLATLPDVSLFDTRFGVQRKNDQQAHDRYVLEYHDGINLAEPWREYISELKSPRYKANLCRLLAQPSVTLNFHWHYTPSGCCVSPHADSVRKAGSHIFYFNTDADWDPAWGGHTVLLDDGGKIPYQSSPRFEDFRAEIPSFALGNRSLLFSRTERAWHGVHPIDCPGHKLRKVFIVVVNRNRIVDKIRRRCRRQQFHYY